MSTPAQQRRLEKLARESVALEEKRHRLTLEALAEVDAGRTLDHIDIETWAKALGKQKRSRRR